jgi:peptidoglycan hydrolase CwlO-like protein
MLNFEKDTKKGYLVLILMFIIILLVTNTIQFLFLNQTHNNTDYLKKQVLKIESDIEKYQSENELIFKKIDGHENAIIKIDSSISKNNESIDELKSNSNEKINNFKHYNARMWEEFFANRYNK